MTYYEPKKCNQLSDCLDLEKYKAIVDKIACDNLLSSNQKYFLSLLASRQIEFKYNKLADYYANADSHMKEYLENLHLVIVDDERAIEKGLFKYFEQYEELVKEVVDERE